MKYLIFDFDGVLADSFEACIQVRLRINTARSRQEAIQQVQKYSNNPVDHAKNHTMTDVQMSDRKIFLKKWWDLQLTIWFPLFDGFIKEIKKLDDVKMSVVSSNSVRLLHAYLDVLWLSMTHMLWFEDHHSKEEKIEYICRDRWIDISQVYYFTDTKADVYELKDMVSKDKLIGCSRGFSWYDALAEVLLPQYIMRDFTDIHKYMI